MVIADQMQRSMNKQSQHFFIQGVAQRFGLASGRGHRNHDVPEQERITSLRFPIGKRQDVRGSILIPIRPVQPSHPRIANQTNTDFGLGLVKESQERPGDATQCRPTNRHAFHLALNTDGHESIRGQRQRAFILLHGRHGAGPLPDDKRPGRASAAFIHQLPQKPHFCPFRFHVGCRP